MSALVPSDAVVLLYRRYLKAANAIPNVTIRMLLLQQIRAGFRRNRTVRSPAAQRELLNQAHKDLNILEDERLSRTLYINRLGLVSCLDWEVRRTEYNFARSTQLFWSCFLTLAFFVFAGMVWCSKGIEQYRPDLAKMVDLMALRLEADSAAELQALREKQIVSGLERRERQLSLEHRILATFYETPNVPSLQTLRRPEGDQRGRLSAG